MRSQWQGQGRGTSQDGGWGRGLIPIRPSSGLGREAVLYVSGEDEGKEEKEVMEEEASCLLPAVLKEAGDGEKMPSGANITYYGFETK